VTRRASIALLLLGLAAGCARQPAPVTHPVGAPSQAPVRIVGERALQQDLTALFRAPAFSNALWGVLVRSLDNGQTLFALNPGTLLMPASNMKLVTMSVAAERLGWDYRFETKLVSDGPVEDGVLKGDLIVAGSGDPSIGARGESTRVFDLWADALKAQGIETIDGRIIGDDNALDDEGLGQGWAWDYLSAGYATPSGALEFNENLVQLVLKPGAAAGDRVAIEVRPEGHGLTIDSRVVTGPADSGTNIDFRRMPGSSILRVTGSVPVGRADVVRAVSVDNPTTFFVGVLKAALTRRGIAVRGDAVDVDDLLGPIDSTTARVLYTHTSPTLAEIGKVMLKVSQNLYADTLLKVVGRVDGGQGSAESGRKVVQQVLQGWAIAPDRYVQVDGSGLSRYNYLTTDVLVGILTAMYRDDRHRGPFIDALPVAGTDGTLAGRMKGTLAEGNAKAKTGSISNARALSGYVTTAAGEHLVFSMIANNFNVPQSQADAVIDTAVAHLAGFRRK
jgi:D-alanyl-D-alanine carboxypeptidase/D-alanyl-D-alanine-endopeptidase (penicillin-binding protein 4)